MACFRNLNQLPSSSSFLFLFSALPSTMAETSKFHSALAITNVKTLIPTLDLESGQYHSWAVSFKVHARVHNELEHITPPTDAKEKVVYDKVKSDDLPLWKRLDAAVL